MLRSTALRAAMLACLALLLTGAPAMGDTFAYNLYTDGYTLQRGNSNGQSGTPIGPAGVPGPRWPAVSPDGQKVVMETPVRGTPVDPRWGIWVSDMNGNNPRQVWQDDGSTGWGQPSWHPDNSRLIFEKGTSTTESGNTDLFSINEDGTGLTPVIQLGGFDGSPKYSWDGSKIVWTHQAEGGEPHVYVADSTGLNMRDLGLGHDPEFSPDGTHIVFSAPRPPTGELWIAIMQADGKKPRWQTQGRNPTWSPDNHVMVFRRGDDLYKMQPWAPWSAALLVPGNGYQALLPSFRQASYLYPRPASIPTPPGPPEPTTAELLEWYSPELRYDQLDSYRADHPATLTDTYVSGSSSNFLKRSSQKILAASDPGQRYDDLNFNWLAPTYPGRVGTAATGDFVDLSNDYATDAQRMHSNPNYANRVNGRIVAYPDGSKVAQYWFWFYNNPKTFFTRGAHEGDWEMIQVHLRPDNSPSKAAYSQHDKGEVCNWVNVQRNGNDRPIVYVADGSHASYFSAGSHEIQTGVSDTAAGNGDRVYRSTLIDVTSPPNWLRWPGHWGGTPAATGTTGSPAGPMQQGGPKWSDPAAWTNSASVEPCGETQLQPARRGTRKPRKARPSVNRTIPVPSIKTQISGRKAVVSYDFGKEANAVKSQLVLITSVQGRGKNLTPLTFRRKLSSAQGEVRFPLGLGRAPYTLRVAVEAPAGRSRILTRKLQR